MKALTDRLEWTRLYLTGVLGDDTKAKKIALDELLMAMAIAEALPEITMTLPGGAELLVKRAPPKRIVEL